MSAQIKIHTYHIGDEIQIVNLLKMVFNGWPRFDVQSPSLEHWKWKHLESPNKSIVVVAESDDKIIGCWHRVIQKINFRDRVQFSTQGVDVAVHHDYKGRNISWKLRELAAKIASEQNIGMMVGVNSNLLIRKSAIRRGHVALGNIYEYIKIQDIGLHMKFSQSKYKILLKFGYRFFSRYNQIIHLTDKMRLNNLGNIRFYNVNEFDDKIEEFWNDIKTMYAYATVRDKDYLNWRYCDKRGGEYVIRLAEERGSIVGYCVFRVNRFESYPEGYLVDLVTSPERLDIMDYFIRDAVKFFNENNLNTIRIWNGENSVLGILLLKYGFIKMDKKYVQYKIMDDQIGSSSLVLKSRGQILFSLGDSDHI